MTTGDFDVFLCYNSSDKTEVKVIAEQLKERGILPWLDVWELQPGSPWQRALEKQIPQIKSVAVFVGSNGMGPWEDLEVRSFLREFARREVGIIPVILESTLKAPDLPIFLEDVSWVDFRETDPDPLEHLIWGITQKKGDLL
ncbi:toll/interleukin-1 receptor domain-containing protein [Candidatus Poribacteria bacterium]|nr:toll/interleukin-1 receptor domain-containing protein [Candidatus Poribacteria bacterium]